LAGLIDLLDARRIANPHCDSISFTYGRLKTQVKR
jgi:hypothetical protein